jgi:hypothetical protein
MRVQILPIFLGNVCHPSTPLHSVASGRRDCGLETSGLARCGGGGMEVANCISGVNKGAEK